MLIHQSGTDRVSPSAHDLSSLKFLASLIMSGIDPTHGTGLRFNFFK